MLFCLFYERARDQRAAFCCSRDCCLPRLLMRLADGVPMVKGYYGFTYPRSKQARISINMTRKLWSMAQRSHGRLSFQCEIGMRFGAWSTQNILERIKVAERIPCAFMLRDRNTQAGIVLICIIFIRNIGALLQIILTLTLE
jgi:hypothetical protein